MNKFSVWLCTISSASVLFSAGCASPGIQDAYDGPRKKPVELASVLGITTPAHMAFSPSRERLSFMSVDGDSTVPWYSPASYPTAIYVLPGKRKVEVQYEHVHGVARSPIWVDARSNRTYQVKVMNPQSRTERVYFVIEDTTAQTLVGGTEKKTDE